MIRESSPLPPRRRWLRVLAVAVLLLVAAAVAALYRPDLPPEVLEARYAPAPSRFAEVAGVRIHFRDEGPDQVSPQDAPVLMLLHGTAASLHTWDGWVEELRDRYRLVRLDLLGFGLTGPEPRHDYSTGRQVALVAALAEHLGVERMAVAGNSLGGRIAWSMTTSHTEQVSHLVLLAPAGAPRNPRATANEAGFRTLDLARVPVLGRLLIRLTPRFLIRRSLEQVYGDPSKLDENLIDRYHEILLREGNREALFRALTQRRTAAGGAGGPKLEDVHQPTLILWGEEDRWIPPSFAERFHADLSDSELLLYPGVGHVPMEEIPERTARDTAEFLDRHGFGRAAEAAPSSGPRPEAGRAEPTRGAG